MNATLTRPDIRINGATISREDIPEIVFPDMDTDIAPISTPPPVEVLPQAPELELQDLTRRPDYANMSEPEQNKYRATFIVKFGILKQAWPAYELPDISDGTSLDKIHDHYEVFVKYVHIHSSVFRYRFILAVMWLFIEFTCNRFGMNITGYTKYQIRSISKYERLLIELGEAKYNAKGADYMQGWPGEVKILAIAVIQALIFFAIKTLANWIGETNAISTVEQVMEFINQQPQTAADPVTNKQQQNPLDMIGMAAGFLGKMMEGNKESVSKPVPKADRPRYFTE
jgi:hypothetical protein